METVALKRAGGRGGRASGGGSFKVVEDGEMTDDDGALVGAAGAVSGKLLIAYHPRGVANYGIRKTELERKRD